MEMSERFPTTLDAQITATIYSNLFIFFSWLCAALKAYVVARIRERRVL